MGPLRRHGRLQQDGTPKCPVETLSCQSAVQGGCSYKQGRWRCTHVGFSEGDQYFYSQVSDTYPADLFVPKSATPPVIVGSSKFRSRGRFPALSYYSKENQVCWWHFSSLSQRYIVSNFLPILSKLFILISKGFSHANQISFLDLNPYLIKIHLWIHCRPDLTSHI